MRDTIEFVVQDKGYLYFRDQDKIKSCENLMCLAGPYWFSTLIQDPLPQYISFLTTIYLIIDKIRPSGEACSPPIKTRQDPFP